ncbi:hypothetical protein OO184_21270 [Photorhabdus sp. APURE]|uniref:hypothetical protein n=1 Tax=Photorhabdus aballayi TaxID=2991723 RepID=UPI00223C955B|nr:hypothetical protein [Photorhabdus aballayi]MCW7550392.1 hypothetical protein [Photorhabdus aballayi]
MPVKLNLLPGPAPRPKAPRLLFWFVLLPGVFFAIGITSSVLWDGMEIHHQPISFWLHELAILSLCWVFIVGCRWLLYTGQHLWADGWDQRRQLVILQETQRGRRSLQILSVALYTALVDEETPERQVALLTKNEKALKAQPSWLSENAVRHSRLPTLADESSDELVRRTLSSIVATFAKALELLPDNTPLSLLFEANTILPEHELRNMWQQVWSEAGIRQPVSFVEGAGLSVVDDWLDNHICKRSLLMVVALQICPVQPERTAESAVGLILGNRLTQKTLTPQAFLHRPECASHLTLVRSVQQALDWVPIIPESLQHVWLSQLSRENSEAFTALSSMIHFGMTHEQGLYDLDILLGTSGCVAPWLVIAAAALHAQCTTASQFILSGSSVSDEECWCAVVFPNETLQEVTQ